MKYVYESRGPRTVVLVPSRSKLEPDGFRVMTPKIQAVFGDSGIFILDDSWCTDNGITMERGKKLLEGFCGGEIKLTETLTDDDQKIQAGTLKPVTNKVIDGPASRANAKG